MIRYGLIGAGGIGAKRAACLEPGQLVAVYDIDPQRTQALVAKFGAGRVATSLDDLLNDPQVDAVLVATLHDSLAPLTLRAIQAGKHVLVEKPAACRAADLLPLIEAQEEHGVRVRVGFNHRYHPAMQKARQIVSSGALGPLMFIRARYGHGGRLGYESEWRARPELSGGGELIDQGVHLIDLARWFLGDFPHVHGTTATYFWKMPVDDNAFLELKTAGGQIAWLHASCTEWKNLFSMEIYGRDGKLQIDGLGGSYGPERLIHYRMQPEMGPPPIDTYDFPGPDGSWKREMQEFEEDIELGLVRHPGLKDAHAVLGIVGQVYRANGASWV